MGLVRKIPARWLEAGLIHVRMWAQRRVAENVSRLHELGCHTHCGSGCPTAGVWLCRLCDRPRSEENPECEFSHGRMETLDDEACRRP